MADADRQTTTSEERYRALLGVSEAIATQRDLPALFHELGRQLGQVVSFDYLSWSCTNAATDAMRLHVVLETREPVSLCPVILLRPEDDPAGLVWQTQQPLITSNVAELRRWPRLLERVQPYGVQSYCCLPLTTARRRLGTLVFTSKQAASLSPIGPALPPTGRQPGRRRCRECTGLGGDQGTEGQARQARKRIWRRRFEPSTISATSSVRTRPCARFSNKSRPSLRPSPRCSSAAKPAPARS